MQSESKKRQLVQTKQEMRKRRDTLKNREIITD